VILEYTSTLTAARPRKHTYREPYRAAGLQRQIRSIRRSTSLPALQSLVIFLVLSRLDYGSVTFIGISRRVQDRLQSVLNESSRLIFNGREYDRISPLLRDLHGLRVPERIKFCLSILVLYKLCGYVAATICLRPC